MMKNGRIDKLVSRVTSLHDDLEFGGVDADQVAEKMRESCEEFLAADPDVTEARKVISEYDDYCKKEPRDEHDPVEGCELAEALYTALANLLDTHHPERVTIHEAD